ncbi:hypothetical protein [Bifidobacterium biavatii]|uniref:Uncharacterized protein n=1 Tax=Bifidobacterium biavatii DSM 23969 TaxID=1437608 RepID=A0A086ZHW6_9BIFI|nr:hypothetical protein [Bifidobacterium biavatii]KFI46116.1 hypothetical protein BBIA_2081 [Bifidobacterium biavatii DSM 23969]
MASIAMGAEWKKKMVRDANRKINERLAREKKLYNQLVSAVSEMRGGAAEAQKVVREYMKESRLSVSEISEVLSLTNAEKRMVFGDDVLGQLDDSADDESDQNASETSGTGNETQEPASDVGSTDDAGRSDEPADDLEAKDAPAVDAADDGKSGYVFDSASGSTTQNSSGYRFDKTY